MAGAPLLSPGVVVGALRYGETSRIVRLATPHHGVISCIAKGASRPRSRFGAALRLLSEGQAHLVWSRSSDLHTLAAFDLRTPHAGLAAGMDRFLAASVLAELMVRFVPGDANPAVYELLVHALALLENAASEEIPVLAIHLVWQLVTELGVAPSVAYCVRDGTAIVPGEGGVMALEEGGLLCPGCGAALRGGIRLAGDDVAALGLLLAPEGALPVLDGPHLAAHRRLLSRWVHHHLSEGTLPAMDLWLRGVSP